MRLKDLPRPTPLSAYEETREAVRRMYRGLAGIDAVLEYGTIPLLGISDIDLIVIAEPHAYPAVPSMKIFTAEQRFVLSHRPFVLSRSTHSLLRFIDPWILHATPLLEGTEAYGLKGVRTLTEEEHHWTSIRRMLQWCWGFARLIARVRATDVVACRTFLDHIIGIKYFYRELKRMGLAEETQDSNIPFFVELREKWFLFTEAELQGKMEEAVERFAVSLHEFLAILASHLEKSEGKRIIRGSFAPRGSYQRRLLREFPRSVIIDGRDEIRVYQEGRTDIELRYESCRTGGGGRYDRFLCVLPLSLSYFENNFIEGEGVISHRYRTHAFTDLDGIPALTHPVIRQFVDMADRSEGETGHLPLKKLYDVYGYRSRALRLGGLLERVRCDLTEIVMRGPFASLLRVYGHRSIL